jgi:UDP-glucose 4-epimerase
MKYLVTGGAGFIGSHISNALINNGDDVRVLDNLASGHLRNLKDIADKIEFVEGDVRDPETCISAAKGCDGIFHQAALVSVVDSIERPRDNHDINITGTMNLLEAARTQGCKRIVFASSAAIYGNNPTLPKKETMLPEPLSPYGAAKICGEHCLQAYAEQFGLSCIALRYFNVYGPRQDPSSMYSGVISKFVECAKDKVTPTIFGDGKQTRDFVFVEDIVQANVKAMTSNDNIKFLRCNIGTGIATCLLDVIEALRSITGELDQPILKNERPGDIRHSLADISLAREKLGFEPQKTDLKANLSKVLDFDSGAA